MCRGGDARHVSAGRLDQRYYEHCMEGEGDAYVNTSRCKCRCPRVYIDQTIGHICIRPRVKTSPPPASKHKRNGGDMVR
jgi:hypothetical protein